jgi:phage gp29-like protein
MKTLKQFLAPKLAAWLKGAIPVVKSTAIDPRQEPPFSALTIDASKLFAILTAAEGGYTRDLFALYRDIELSDSHLQGEMAKRVLAVIGDTLTFVPADKSKPEDVALAKTVSEAFRACPGWRQACIALLKGAVYPLSIIEKTYASQAAYRLSALTPVPYQCLDYTTGRLKLYDIDPKTGALLGSSREPDPNRYIIHRGHTLATPDNWGGPMRSILFWWLLSAMDREWWSRFLERYGSPFLLGKFSDDEGRNVLQQAFSLATKLGGLVISESTSAEIKQAAVSDSGQAYSAFLSICQREKSKLILGQTLSAEAQPTGLGSGVASTQENVRQDIRKFDALMLSETLRDQLIVQFCRINNLPGTPPFIAWGSDSSEEVRATAGLLRDLAAAGLEPDDSAVAGLSERVGFGLRRRAAPAVGQPGGLVPFSVGSWRTRENARRIVLASRTRAEAMERLKAEMPSASEAEIGSLIGALT